MKSLVLQAFILGVARICYGGGGTHKDGCNTVTVTEFCTTTVSSCTIPNTHVVTTCLTPPTCPVSTVTSTVVVTQANTTVTEKTTISVSAPVYVNVTTTYATTINNTLVTTITTVTPISLFHSITITKTSISTSIREHVPPGEIVGLTIGLFAAGALVAAIPFFFRRPEPRPEEYGNVSANPPPEQYGTGTSTAPPPAPTYGEQTSSA